MGENMTIKVGQIWVTEENKEPVMINEVGRWVEYRFFENGEECFDSYRNDDFICHFEFFADCMSEEDFKELCVTGKNPTLTLKSETEIKDSEIIYQSAPVAHDPIKITRHMNFNRGNAVKYLMRAGLKDPAKEVEDLQKAAWYIQDEIKRIKGDA